MIMPYESPVLSINLYELELLSISGTDCPVKTGDQDFI